MEESLAKNLEILQKALEACRTREQWSAFVESPSTRIHGEAAPAQGKAAFEACLNRPFELDQPGEAGRLGAEVSPYTREPLGIDYPAPDVDAICRAARQAGDSWRSVDPDMRAMVCIAMLKSLEKRLFERLIAVSGQQVRMEEDTPTGYSTNWPILGGQQ